MITKRCGFCSESGDISVEEGDWCEDEDDDHEERDDDEIDGVVRMALMVDTMLLPIAKLLGFG